VRALAVLVALAATLLVPLAQTPAQGPRAHAAGRTVLAASVTFPTNIAFDSSGGMWLTSGAGVPRASDGVWYLPPGGHIARHVAGGLHTALGLTWYHDHLYVGSISSPSDGVVTELGGFDGHRFATRKRVLRNLPIGRHTVDSIVPGPGGRLYVGVGSTFDNHGRAGRVLSFLPNGSDVKLEATGLRNPYGLAFIPHTSELLVSDNGRDDLGLFKPPDELDAFDVSGPIVNFGFPRCYDQGGSACHGTVAPLVRFGAHASSDGIAMSADGRTAYVAENGSSFSGNPTGSDVQKISLSGSGATLKAHRTLLSKAFTPHDPLGAAIGPDGRLYVTRFVSGGVVVVPTH
jgi:glucose/arabinose dehydrogenase